jgi:hypothetical protein
MISTGRRVVPGAIFAALLARPGWLRAETLSAPIKVGLLSDLGGPEQTSLTSLSAVSETSRADLASALSGQSCR